MKQNINSIPHSVLVLVFTHVSTKEILPLILTCKMWERILYGEEYWFAMCENKIKATLSSGRLDTKLRSVLSQLGFRNYLRTVISQLGLSSCRSLFPVFLTELLTGFEPATLFTRTPPGALIVEQPPVGSDQIPCILADSRISSCNPFLFLILKLFPFCLYYYSGPLVLGFHLLLELSGAECSIQRRYEEVY